MGLTAGRSGFLLCACALATYVIATGYPEQAWSQNRSKSQKSSPPASANGGGDLAERIQQLESQIVDMRVVIDTLDSLGRRGQAAGPMPAGGGSASTGPGNVRIDILETQVKALTTQVEQLAAEVRALSGNRPAGQGASSQSQGGWQTRQPANTWNTQPRTPEVRGFDSRAPTEAAAQRPYQGGGAISADANRSYLQAINLYNQDDFKGARDAISAFVKTYPDHPQVPTAQYRLAQSNYKLGQYAQAAQQFWALVKAYPREPVAPDSFAMFAAALGRSGRSKDACEAYQQLRVRFPNDAPHMPPEARTEQSRLGC